MLAPGRDKPPHDSSGSTRRFGARSNRSATRFDVLERLGDGTLWIVYRVKERAGASSSANRPLALKALKSAPNRHPRLPGALASSLEAWQKIEHAGIASPLDIGSEEGTFFFTSEFLSGGSLETTLGRGACSPELALRLLNEIAGALGAVHAHGLAHGDVRPRQILLDTSGRPVLTDGGLAHAFAQAGLALSDVQAEAASYLAPENAAGALPSQAGDIYALGVVFYRMLTGRVPFDAPSAVALAARHRSDAPIAPSQFKANLAPTWDALALRLLAKNPDERPDAARLQSWLADAATVQTKPAATAPAKNNGTAATPVVATPGVAPVIEPSTNVSSTKDFVVPANSTTAASSTNVPVPNPPTVAPVPVAAVPVVTAVAAPATKHRLDDAVAQRMAIQAEEARVRDLKIAKRRHRRREFWGALRALLWLVVLGAAGVGGVVGAYTLWIDNTPKEVTVPAYINKSQREAQKILAKRGLMLRIVRETYDPRLPAGTIVAGEPEPGRLVRARREVLATISAGEAPIKMVDFEKITLPQARQIIVKHGLRLGPIVQQFHDTVPSGFICGQFPEPNEPLRRSEPITLIVSRGRQPTDIDATTGTGLVAETEPVAAPVVADDGFEPLEPAGGIAPASSGLVKRRATVRVQVPAGGSQIVRLMVRDAGGERTVYQRVHGGGERVSQIVSVERAEGETALVRVYVGEELIKEEQL